MTIVSDHSISSGICGLNQARFRRLGGRNGVSASWLGHLALFLFVSIIPSETIVFLEWICWDRFHITNFPHWIPLVTWQWTIRPFCIESSFSWTVPQYILWIWGGYHSMIFHVVQGCPHFFAIFTMIQLVIPCSSIKYPLVFSARYSWISGDHDASWHVIGFLRQLPWSSAAYWICSFSTLAKSREIHSLGRHHPFGTWDCLCLSTVGRLRHHIYILTILHHTHIHTYSML